jgi:hypothetical protein
VVTGMIAARDATPLPRAAEVVGVLAWALVELLSFLLAMWAALGWRCDESCNDNLVPEARSGGWGSWIHSRQWTPAWIIPGVALLVTLSLLGGAWRGRLPRARFWVATALSVAWLALAVTV